VGVCGEAIREQNHENPRNGTLGAIDFTMKIDKPGDSISERVVVTLNDRFLPW
jgi:cyanate lyase